MLQKCRTIKDTAGHIVHGHFKFRKEASNIVSRSDRNEKGGKIMKKYATNKILGILSGALLAGSLLAGCGAANTGAAASNTTDAKATEAAATGADAKTTEAAATTGTDAKATDAQPVESKGTITVAASQTPHSEILAQAVPILKEQGWDLQVTVFDDYVQPNNVVESEEFDANYFQHIPYLDSFNEEQGTHLVNAAGIHYEPFGIYAGTKSNLADLADGDEIAVPNDTTNEARALLLLEANGILTLKEGAGLTATVNDVESYSKDIKIVELAAESVKDAIPDAAFVVLNGNYALQAGLSVGKDALACEAADSEAAKTYVNVIAVKEGHENDEKIKALIDALTSDTVTRYITDTYDGAVVPFK